ncbi:hypothetical protein SEPCBS119000_002269 [Sporothrix epigloea]|uniref:Sodium/calcium exchanger membrane region domain-containing protein n=1 Tax=Sporothrix epigloea TaxID=1892477 RepID=A0ABP0DIF3_9PEZI
MKTSPSDPPDPDLSRLSPTQADGDSFRLPNSSSRRHLPGVVAFRAALSESNLLQSKQQQLRKKQALQQSDRTEHSIDKYKNSGNYNTHDGGGSVQTPVSGSGNNTGVNSPVDNTPATVSPASTSTEPLQKAWSGPVLEDVRDSGKQSEKVASVPQYPSRAARPVTFTANSLSSTALASDTAASAKSPKNESTTIDLGQSSETAAGTSTETKPKVSKAKTLTEFVLSFFVTSKRVLLYSWLNVFLVFVPAGIIVGALPGLPPAVVFSINAIAIVPLAGLLGFATETVAYRMGDSIGALLNITFGNAGEIRIVQASLLGSILTNLLLILGMSFLLGGLRFREQIYNSTVTQMSACLLSLSVISLVLPTAFHASFKSTTQADKESLKISRGTSVILLLVYGIYLLFQLKSHAYMYQSTPQHIIDEESTPGPAAGWLDTSSSDDSSSTSSDSDTSGHSRGTMKKRMRRVIRGGRRRKSSMASSDTAESIFAGTTRTPSFSAAVAGGGDSVHASEDLSGRPSLFPRLTPDMNEDDVDEKETASHRHKKRERRRSRYRKGRGKLGHLHGDQDLEREDVILETAEGGAAPIAMTTGLAYPVLVNGNTSTATIFLAEPTANAPNESFAAGYTSGEPRRRDFAIADPSRGGASTVDEFGNPTGSAAAELASARRAFNLRAMSSLRPVAKSFAPTVFTQPAGAPLTDSVRSGPIPRIRYGIRHTNSLPDPLSQQYQFRPPGAMLPSQIPSGGFRVKSSNNLHIDDDNSDDLRATMSRKAAILLLLVTTGLVAVCAEFMVSSINGLVATSSVGEVFIGLIVLPIVGNAAEHVTAVMVAMKNKMDLAIGVAVGSSIQIALFMTPLVVILGWIMDRNMTLYFTLFETVCLFVSTFIVNFLVLDGRSNYLEGALLCTTYVIISLVAFFYPKPEDASSWG